MAWFQRDIARKRVLDVFPVAVCLVIVRTSLQVLRLSTISPRKNLCTLLSSLVRLPPTGISEERNNFGHLHFTIFSHGSKTNEFQELFKNPLKNSRPIWKAPKHYDSETTLDYNCQLSKLNFIGIEHAVYAGPIPSEKKCWFQSKWSQVAPTRRLSRFSSRWWQHVEGLDYIIMSLFGSCESTSTLISYESEFTRNRPYMDKGQRKFWLMLCLSSR